MWERRLTGIRLGGQDGTVAEAADSVKVKNMSVRGVCWWWTWACAEVGSVVGRKAGRWRRSKV